MNSNSPETLTLIARETEATLAHTLGPDITYVLVITNGEFCNCISNAPVNQASELQDAFRELSERTPVLAFN